MQLFMIGLIGVGTAILVGLAGGLVLKLNHRHLRSSETTEVLIGIAGDSSRRERKL
jgi:hypothetical protein